MANLLELDGDRVTDRDLAPHNTADPLAPMSVSWPWVVDALGAMAAMPDNWDGYGGRKPDPAAVRAAEAFVETVGDLVRRGRLPRIDEPFVSAVPDGGVLFAWDETAAGGLEVEFIAKPTGVRMTYNALDPLTHDSVQGTAAGRGGDTLPFVLVALLRSARMRDDCGSVAAND